MYRVMEMSGKMFAVELLTSGRSMTDEWEEMEQFVIEGTNCIITEDYEEFDAELIVRDYI